MWWGPHWMAHHIGVLWLSIFCWAWLKSGLFSHIEWRVWSWCVFKLKMLRAICFELICCAQCGIHNRWSCTAYGLVCVAVAVSFVAKTVHGCFHVIVTSFLIPAIGGWFMMVAMVMANAGCMKKSSPSNVICPVGGGWRGSRRLSWASIMKKRVGGAPACHFRL